MRKSLLTTLAALLLIALSIQSDTIRLRTAALAQTKTIPAPKEVLGFTPGDDRKLASWAKVVEYFQKLAASLKRLASQQWARHLFT